MNTNKAPASLSSMAPSSSSLVDQHIARLQNSLHGMDADIEYLKLQQDSLQRPHNPNKDDEEDRYLYISSAMRDTTIASSSESNYTVDLSSEIDAVVGVQLVGGSFSLTVNLVDLTNQNLLFSISPFITNLNAVINPGRYSGPSLAVELTRRMNEQVFAATITGAVNYIEQTTGLVRTMPPLGVYINGQFLVSFRSSDQKFIFQWVDNNLMPLNGNPFRIYIQDGIPNLPPYQAYNDIFDVLGLDRENTQVVGIGPMIINGVNYHYLQNTIAATGIDQDGKSFSFTNNNINTVDAQQRYAIFSSNPANLIGFNVVSIHCRELEENDTVLMKTDPTQGVQIATCLGYFILPFTPNDAQGQLDWVTTGHPLKKIYRQPKRIKRLNFQFRRTDGQFFNFGGRDHFLMFKVTLKNRRGLPQDYPR